MVKMLDMIRIILITALISLLFVDCSDEQSPEKIEEAADPEFEINIKTELDHYQVYMSSVPGLPIEIDTEVIGNELSLSIRAVVNYGGFSLWGEDYKVTYIGNEYVGGFEDVTLYWTPIQEEAGNLPKDASVTIYVVNQTTNEVIDTFLGEITEDEGYSIDF